MLSALALLYHHGGIGGHGSTGPGVIVGGVIGIGIATISIFIASLFFYWQRRHCIRLVHGPSFAVNFESWDCFLVFFSEMPNSLLRSYVYFLILSSSSACICSHNPLFFPNTQYLDYPIIYSEYEVTSPPPAYVSSQVPSLSPNKSLYTVGTVLSSQAQEYHGLPTVHVLLIPHFL